MADSVITEAEISPSTPQVIHELKYYLPFSFERSLAQSLVDARDKVRCRNRTIGVFTSGDDAPGKHVNESLNYAASNDPISWCSSPVGLPLSLHCVYDASLHEG